MTAMRPPRQADVARATGLSQATVSRVLRDDPAVLPGTKARVFAACEELGYRVSIGGRILAAGSKAMVGISLSEGILPTDRYISVIHQHIATELEATGWGTILLPARAFERRLSDIGAAILIGVAHDDRRPTLCERHGVPVVAIGHPAGEVFSVAPDDGAGGRLAARHLLDGGRRRLAVLTAATSTGDPGLTRRRDAFVERAGEGGASVRVVELAHQPTATLAGYRAALGLPAEVDGLFCDTDEAAIGALAALQDAGRTIGPRHGISVIGFDDLPGLAEQNGLTTIAQDFEATAKVATALRLEAETGAAPRRALTDVTLVERST